jgi:hypothetical protein
MGNKKLLQAGCVGTVLFGALMLLLPAATRAGFGWMMFGDANAMNTWPEPARWYVTLVHGVLGAVMVGWGVALLMALRGPSARASHEAWQLVLVSALCWFVPDTLFSASIGAWPNVALNCGFALLFGAGLWVARGAGVQTRVA